VKNFTFAVALLLGSASAAQAAPLEFIEASSLSAQALQAKSAPVASISPADLTVVRSPAVVAPPAHMSELPEPEVFLMMLLGLCLIGYRASRHSDEKFE
jgi:hypothetical protein